LTILIDEAASVKSLDRRHYLHEQKSPTMAKNPPSHLNNSGAAATPRVHALTQFQRLHALESRLLCGTANGTMLAT
jgi:hypothetical protein